MRARGTEAGVPAGMHKGRDIAWCRVVLGGRGGGQRGGGCVGGKGGGCAEYWRADGCVPGGLRRAWGFSFAGT